MNSQRIYYLDVLKIIATLGVICIHTSSKELYTEFISYNWYLSAIFDGFARWSVPIFVMVSGALFLNPQKEISTKRLITKNISRLLIIYLLWWILYSVLNTVWGLIFDNTFVFTIKKPSYHLWFLPMLIGVYFLIPILREIATNKKLTLYYLTIWFIYISGGFAFTKDIPQISGLFSINSIIGYSGYFLLGYFISTYSISKKQSRIIYLLGFLGLLMTILGCILHSIYLGETCFKFFEYLSPNTILVSTALFVFIKEKSIILSHRGLNFINNIRKDLFGIYLIHPAYLLIFNHDMFMNLCNHIITIPACIIVVFTFSLYTTKLLRLTPIRKIVE